MLTDGFERLVEDLSESDEGHDSDDMENEEEYSGVKLESLIDKDDSQLLPKISGKVNNRAMKKKINKLKKATKLASNIDHHVDEISTKIPDSVVVAFNSPPDILLDFTDNSDNGKVQLVESEMNSNNDKTDMKQIECKVPNESEQVCANSNPFDEESPVTTALNPFSDEFAGDELEKDISKDNNKKSQLKSNNISENQTISNNESLTIEKVASTKIRSVKPSVERSGKFSSNPFDSNDEEDITTTSPAGKQNVLSSSLSKKQMFSTETNAKFASLPSLNKKEINKIEKTTISSTTAIISNINKNGEIFMKLKKLGFSDKFVMKALQLNKNDFVLTLGWLRDEISGRERANNVYSNSTGTVWKPPLITRISSWMPNISAANTSIPSETDRSSGASANSAGTEGSSCIGYYITVLCNDIDNVPQGASSPSWKVVRRYSQFFDLYCKLAQHISSEFPGGRMLSPFCDDRLSVWWYGTTDDICRQRQEKLDQWLREILMTPLMVTNPEVYDMLSEFLEVKIHTPKRTSAIPNSQVAAVNRRVVPIYPTSSSSSSAAAAAPPMPPPPPPPLPVKPAKANRINDSTRNSDVSGGSEPHGDYYQGAGAGAGAGGCPT